MKKTADLEFKRFNEKKRLQEVAQNTVPINVSELLDTMHYESEPGDHEAREMLRLIIREQTLQNFNDTIQVLESHFNNALFKSWLLDLKK